MQAWLLRSLIRVGTHLYLFPLQKQAREVIWNGMDAKGFPFIKYIPEALIANKNEARMEIELVNGSRMVLAGSNNFNSHMGTNPVTIIYSEFALHNPLARQYMNPIIVENGGIEIAQYTPRGMNHGFELLDTVRDEPDYFVQVLNVEQTKKNNGEPIITKAQIDKARKMGMSEEMIRQEFYVDFQVGNVGAYFTRYIAEMRNEGRIGSVPPNPNLPLHSVWDLGGTDATAGWLFQIDGNYINLVAMLHDTGQGLKYYLEQADTMRKGFRCKWGNHWMPHDITQRHQGWEQAESRLMSARKAGWHFLTVPKVNIEDGIEAMRFMFPKLRIDKIACKLGIQALSEYMREFDEVKGCFKPKPLDNWTTHIVDALRYLAVNYKRLYAIPLTPTKYETSL